MGDLIVDIDPMGRVIWSWSAFDHLDIIRYPYFGSRDWTHAISLAYTQDYDLLFSMRQQSWVVKIDYANDYANGARAGDILWRLGEGGDFTLL